jgi:hypothetical protein
MRTFIKSPTRCCHSVTVAAALASLLISAGPLSADEDDKADSADEGMTRVQKEERGAVRYYEEQARKAEKRAAGSEEEASKYYEEEARGAKKRAEGREGEAAEYYEEQAKGAKKRAEEREAEPPKYYRERE